MTAAVLIVEDEDEIRELLAEMLADHGFGVVTAKNGADGLRALRSGTRPHLVLLDLMMPVMDGWQMRAEMLADPQLAGIPVVIISGAADLQDGIEALAAARVLTKPVKWPVLLECVEAHALSA
jgi:CheY-like chemotaxis protein